MTLRSRTEVRGSIAQELAKDRLGVSAVVFFVMSAAAPLTVVAGIIPVAYFVTGLLGIPIAFIVVGLVLALWSVGYVAMSRHLPHAGAFYAYISQGLGRVTGVGAAWVSLLVYNALQVALYGGFGATAAPLFNQHARLDLPWWVFALVMWAFVTVLGLYRVDLNGKVLAVLLVVEVVVIGLYDMAFALDPAKGKGLNFTTYSPNELFTSGIGALLAIAVLGFTGFETTVVFSEESRNPRRTIPAATYAAIAFITALYSISAWAMSVATGVGDIAGQAEKQQGNLVFALAGDRLGTTAADIGNFLLLTSMFAAAISFHNTSARYTFALGREGVLPRTFGGTSVAGVPRAGSLAQSVLGLAIIIVYAIGGWDPFVKLFYTLGTSGGFGALILLAWSAVAIFVYFLRHREHAESTWTTTIAPLLAIVATMIMLVLAIANFATMLGIPEDDPLRWGVPAAFLIIALLGMAYGAWLRLARPAVYAAIGLGAKSTTTSVLAASLQPNTQHPGGEGRA